MRALAIVHQRDAGAGVFAEAIEAAGARLEAWHPAEGEPAPEVGTHDAILTFGGAANVEDELDWLDAERSYLREAIADSVPLLGVCLGAELVAQALGAAVGRTSTPEIGWYPVELTEAGAMDPVLSSLPPVFDAFQWHSFGFEPPDGATELARSEICSQAFVLGSTWAIQFHPEVSPADAEAWIAGYRSDPDAIALGLDPKALERQTRARMGAWGMLGRRLCAAFLAAAGG